MARKKKVKIPEGDWINFQDELPEEGQMVKVLAVVNMTFDGISDDPNVGKWGFNREHGPQCVCAWMPIDEDEDEEVQSSSGSELVGEDEGCSDDDCDDSRED